MFTSIRALSFSESSSDAHYGTYQGRNCYAKRKNISIEIAGHVVASILGVKTAEWTIADVNIKDVEELAFISFEMPFDTLYPYMTTIDKSAEPLNDSRVVEDLAMRWALADLINDEDAHPGNYLYDPDEGSLYAIDFGYSFRDPWDQGQLVPGGLTDCLSAEVLDEVKDRYVEHLERASKIDVCWAVDATREIFELYGIDDDFFLCQMQRMMEKQKTKIAQFLERDSYV